MNYFILDRNYTGFSWWRQLFSAFLLFGHLSTLKADQYLDFTYTVSGNTITITKYTGPGGSVMIPDNINNNIVSKIGRNAFANCLNLTHVIIPNSVAIIDGYAFQNTTITNIDIPNSTVSIEEGAFYNCKYLARANIGNGVVSIGSSAFYNCSDLESVNIPDDATSIGNYAFQNTSITNIFIPKSVTYIGVNAFATKSTIAIIVDSRNLNYCSIDNVLFNYSHTILIKYPSKDKRSIYTIPNGVVTIAPWAFNGCVNLTELTIPDSVTTFEDGAFANCSGLISINIPDSLTWSGNFAFSGCSKLSNASIGKGLKFIGANMFAGCCNLSTITIPNSVTDIGYQTFFECYNLTTIIIPASVTSIGNESFYGCVNLTAVYFEGHPPSYGKPFLEANKVTVFYRPESQGWGVYFASRPTAPWITQPSFSTWAKTIGLANQHPSSSDETDDADLDGLRNIDEMLAGTNPINVDSVLKLETSPRLKDLCEEDKNEIEPWQHALYFQCIPGKHYIVQGSNTPSGPWQVETTTIASTVQKRILVSKPIGCRFYRVMIQ